MESSSEDSFAWADTSNDSSSSSISADDNTSVLKKPAKTKKLKMSNNGTEEHSNTKLEVKIEKERLQSETKSRNLKKKKTVKVEPESDCDIPKKKRKIKLAEENGGEHESQDSASYEESYLDFKVKEEKILASKKKKKESSFDDSKTIEKIKYKDISSDTYVETTSQSLFNGDIDDTTFKKKKKSKKKKTHYHSSSEMESNSKMDIVETDNQYNNSTTESTLNNQTTFSENNTYFGDESGCEEISAIQCDGDDNLHNVSSNGVLVTPKESRKKSNLYKSTADNLLVANNNLDHSPDTSLGDKRTPRISDRIRFEDSDDLDIEMNHSQEVIENQSSSKLRKFMKTNTNMKLVSNKLLDTTILTHDDEIWIVRCPKQIDIQAFCGMDLNVHEKCKVKMGGQTYEGSMEDEQCDTTTALSMKWNKFKIENLPLCGIISFRKRIPKAHIRDDNIMVNNQTNYIPLPETKCRHPLFGSNYKKALKIPAVIAERLNAGNNGEGTIINEKKKKKKHKKERTLDHEEPDCQTIIKPESNLDLEITEKKKKKRRHTDEEGPPPKKVRKIKHDPESAEAWESEKAIEQNLFDF